MTRIHIIGVEFDALSFDEFLAVVSDTILLKKHRIIASQNLHGIYLFHHDRQMRAFYNRAYKIHIDGMPLVFLAKMFGYSVERKHRITYLDMIWPLMEECELNGWRVFYLGGEPGVAEEASSRLRSFYPSLLIETHHGYLKNDEENSQVCDLIRIFSPNILMVGMGMPLQESWILNNIDQLDVNIALTTGACFDYIAGVVPTPPRWMGRVGLEWLFRLASNPQKFWKRYLLEPWYIATLLFSQMFRGKL